MPWSVVQGNVAVMHALFRGNMVADNLLHSHRHNESSRHPGSKITMGHLCVSSALGHNVDLWIKDGSEGLSEFRVN